MKKFTYILTVIILFVQSTALPIQNVEVEISLSKSSYYVGEPIELLVSIKGNENIPFEMVYPMPGKKYISYNIANNIGDEVPYKGYISNPTSSGKYFKVEAGDEVVALFVLNSYYGEHYIGKYYPSYNIIKTGRYTINVKLIFDGNEHTSNTLSFSVINPPNEELIIYNELVRIFNDGNLKDSITLSNNCSFLLNHINKNPESVYNPVILRWLPWIYKYFLQDTLTYDILTEKLIEEYSSSELSLLLIENKLNELENDNDRKNFLLRIKEVAKNSFMEIILEDKLKKMN